MSALPKPNPLAELSQRTVNRYVRMNALMQKLDKERESLRAQILDALRRGLKCPKTSPFLLEIVTQDRCAVTAKQILDQVIAALPPAEQDAALALVAKLQEKRTQVPSLTVKPNPDWGR